MSEECTADDLTFKILSLGGHIKVEYDERAELFEVSYYNEAYPNVTKKSDTLLGALGKIYRHVD